MWVQGLSWEGCVPAAQLWGQGQVGTVPGDVAPAKGCPHQLHPSPSLGPLELKAVLCVL